MKMSAVSPRGNALSRKVFSLGVKGFISQVSSSFLMYFAVGAFVSSMVRDTYDFSFLFSLMMASYGFRQLGIYYVQMIGKVFWSNYSPEDFVPVEEKGE